MEVVKIEKLEQYLKIRQRELSMVVGGLSNSKSKMKDKWTLEDEQEFIKIIFRKKEIESLLKKIIDIDHYIKKSEENIERIKSRKQ